MARTYAELLERLKQVDEISLLEILEVSSEDIVDRFEDRIEHKLTELINEFEDEESDSTAS